MLLNRYWDCFILQLDEPTGGCHFSQLPHFIRIIFNNGSIKEKLMKVIALHEKTGDEGVLKSLYAGLLGRSHLKTCVSHYSWFSNDE
jgi:hypothetical protein